MKVLCCGSRNWDDSLALGISLGIILRDGDQVVHGDAQGADRMAGVVAETLGMEVFKHPAEWDKYGAGAGPKRNQLMLDSHPDITLCLAFTKDLATSKGTSDMVRRCLKAGIITLVIATEADAEKVAHLQRIKTLP